jgi:hypothetical protein
MKKTIFLQDDKAIWLKGNIHSHSVFSDGSLTPEEMKDAYVHHGYDFLAVTDHDVYTDTRKMTDATFTMLQGFELWANAPDDKDIHINFLWADHIDGIVDKQILHLPERTGKQTSAFCCTMKEKGAYIQLNHPHWSMLNSSEIGDENPYDAVEVINYGTDWLENTGNGSVFWSEMLYRGVKLWGGGGDDNHNHKEIDSMYSDSFGGFTVVKAKDRSPEAIMQAMKSGSFYTSTGPSIYDFFVEDGMVHVVCSPCEKIFISGQGRPYQRKLGRFVTEFVTPLKGSEKLVRAECMDARGRSAYTNPIYFE